MEAGNRVGKLADDRAGVRVLDQESHEPEAVVVRPLIRGEEEVARKRRHGRDDWIPHDERFPLRDLNPFVHVHARILAADDVFRRRKEAPQPEHDQGQGKQRAGTRPTGVGAEAEPEPANRGGDEREADVREEQPFKCVAIEQRQCQDN